jgi:hypothetical protein
MAGIFSGNVFGLGQTTASEDAEFSSLISGYASRPPSATSTTITSGGRIPTPTTSTSGGKSGTTTTPTTSTSGGKSGGSAPVMSVGPTVGPTSSAPTNNTVLYVVGGVAVIGVIAALLMASRR